MSRVWLSIIGALALAACDPPPEAEARLLCTTICHCTGSPLPAAQDQCISSCVADDDVRNAPQTCAECIFEHADRCASILNDCAPFCGRSEPPVEDGGPDAGIKGGN